MPLGAAEVVAHPASVEDPQVIAARIVAQSNDNVASAIREAVAAFQPASDTFHSFGARLDALCLFLRRRGPWLLASVPLVLTSVGAVTPDAAKGIHSLIVAFGAHA